jgi:hypothetical protein
MRIFHQTLEELIDEWEGNRKELLQLKILDKVLRGPIDSFAATTMLVEAVRSYMFSLYVGSVLLAAMAIEIGLREFVQRWFINLTKEPASSALPGLIEEVDFRRVIEFCKAYELLGDPNENVYGRLHACYDIRNKYSHAKFSQILEQRAKQPTISVNEEDKAGRFGPVGEDPFLRAIHLHVNVAHDDALDILRLAAENFDVITCKLRAQTQ